MLTVRCQTDIFLAHSLLFVFNSDQSIIQTPLGGVDTLTDGVTLLPSHVPPQNAGILALWH